MLKEIVGSRERKTKTEKYSPFRIRGLGKSSEVWSNQLLGPTGRLISKSKAKIGIYQQEGIFCCKVLLAFRKSVDCLFLLLLLPLSYLQLKVYTERLIDK